MIYANKGRSSIDSLGPGVVDADVDVMQQENQVVFTPDLLSKWGKAFAAWADTTTAAAVYREYVFPYLAPTDAGGALGA